MNIEKERDERFEEAYSQISKPIITRPYPRNANGEYSYKEIHEAYLLWQAAKADEAKKLEGCVVVPEAELGRLKDRITELLDERQDLYAQIDNQHQNRFVVVPVDPAQDELIAIASVCLEPRNKGENFDFLSINEAKAVRAAMVEAARGGLNG